jgi:hypothetical protein
MKPLKRSTKNGKSASSGSIAITTMGPLQFGASTRSSTITRRDSSITVIDLGQMANLRLVDKQSKELVELKLQVLA